MPAPLKTVSELAIVIPGFSPKPTERKQRGQFLLLGGRNIKDGRLRATDADSYVDAIDRESFRRAVALPGDIVVSTLFDRRKLYVYTHGDPVAVVNSSCAIIRCAEQSDYISSYLRTIEGEQDFLEKATKATAGAFIPRLSTRHLGAIQIPMLPFPELARLGDARIEKATRDELLDIKNELESKDAQIARLKAEHDETVRFLKDRIRAVEEQLETNDLSSRIRHGETATLEFKSSLRWNIHKAGFDKEIENSVLKTIVAFCNTSGGELLIGVADDGTILGIEHDDFSNADKFQLHLRNLLVDRISPNLVELVEYRMVTLEGKAICHVSCKQSRRAGVWLKPDKSPQEHFFVRFGPTSTELPPSEAVEYILSHFEGRKG
jgi:hypothetical protein